MLVELQNGADNGPNLATIGAILRIFYFSVLDVHVESCSIGKSI